MFKPTIGTQYRVIDSEYKTFGVGKVTTTVLGLATLVNRNDEECTVEFKWLVPVRPSLGDVASAAVADIKDTIQHLTSRGQIKFVRSFSDLHDQMDANVLLLNHIPEMFPADADEIADDRQVDLENRVCEMVNEWMLERWDTDPYNQPAPSEVTQVASILAAMLDMSLEEMQWGNASVVEVLPEINADEVRLLVGDEQFTIKVTKTTTPILNPQD
jgi:hypothetical protein